VPVPGWGRANEWVGFIPYDELPHLYQPGRLYCLANNRVAGPDYPHWLGWDYVSGDRAERIIELILTARRSMLAYIQQMQLDQVSPSAQTMARVVGQLASLRQTCSRWLTACAPGTGRWRSTARSHYVRGAHPQLLLIILESRLGELMPRYAGKLLNEVVGGGTWGHHSASGCARRSCAPIRPGSTWAAANRGMTCCAWRCARRLIS
jgi:hypothetical protein